MIKSSTALGIFCLAMLSIGSLAGAEDQKPQVLITTSQGEMVVELWPEKSPITVENFLTYVRAGFYDGLIFHRVIGNFMIQGGGFDAHMNPKKPTHPPIKNEARNGLKNEKGTLAMARTPVVDSATSQFFINVADNNFLNHKSDNPQEFGYAVFGKVVKGMETVDKIKAVKTATKGPHGNVPEEPVVIKSMKIIQPK